ncbi:MAG: class I SAM-dependent methyltransferase [Acidimicrobiales bacterium]
MSDDATNPWMEERLARFGHDGTVLDLGCGRGWWLARMAAQGIAPLGVERDPTRAATAAARTAAPVVVADGRRLPIADQSVSLVWCVHVLHHLADPAAALAEARRVLRDGGRLVVAETVEDHPAIRIARRLRPEWDGVAVASRFTAVALLAMLQRAGLEVVDQRQHSWVSFASWASPIAPRRVWVATSRWEERLRSRWPPLDRASRFGAHLECVAIASVS